METGNLRAAKNGSRLARLTLGSLPKKLHRVQRTVRAYRRTLETLVVEAKGEVSLADAHKIDLIAKAEQHSALCRHILRERYDRMTVSEMMSCSETILKATERRNKAFETLGLDETAASRFRTEYERGLAAIHPDVIDVSQ